MPDDWRDGPISALIERAEHAEAERDTLRTQVEGLLHRMTSEEAATEIERLRAEVERMGESVNIMGRVAVNLGQAKQIGESALVDLQRDDDHDQAFLEDEILRLMDDVQSTGKLWHEAESRAEKAEGLLRELIEAEDDCAPIPRGWFARARAALRDTAPGITVARSACAHCGQPLASPTLEGHACSEVKVENG